MKKEELLSKYKELSAEREALDKKSYNYVIEEPCMQLGRICGMNLSTIKTAYGVIDEMTSVSEKAVKELGIDVSAFNENDEEFESFEGHTREQWIADLKTRVSEIQDYRRIKAIDAALPLIEKWLSEDDVFALDMEKIEALLGK